MEPIINLSIAKPEKVRAGLYLDSVLHQVIAAIAEHNGISFNEAAILLIDRGIQAYQQDSGE